MGHIWTALLGLIALLWIVQGLRTVFGVFRIPAIRDATPLADADCPAVSVLFAARDESEKLPAALATLLAMDYPRLEIVAADDRSSDGTARILDAAAQNDPRLQVVHVAELPPGWLGKTHALQKAFERSTGDWLVFTDADVRFAPDLLRRALTIVREHHWSHLTLLTHVDLVGFWEKAAISYWAMSFNFGLEPWKASNPKSGRYVGVGAFQLLRRDVYEAVGTHRRLAMEVIDDMKLGKLVKRGGYRSGLGRADEWVRLRWQDGLVNVVRGLTKNTFAACDYSVARVVGSVIFLLAISVVPWVAVFVTTGVKQALAGAAVCVAAALQAAFAHALRMSPLFGLTHPFGGAVMSYVLLRSMVVTLWRGGVVWRGTFYPLDELRRGMV